GPSRRTLRADPITRRVAIRGGRRRRDERNMCELRRPVSYSDRLDERGDRSGRGPTTNRRTLLCFLTEPRRCSTVTRKRKVREDELDVAFPGRQDGVGGAARQEEAGLSRPLLDGR